MHILHMRHLGQGDAAHCCLTTCSFPCLHAVHLSAGVPYSNSHRGCQHAERLVYCPLYPAALHWCSKPFVLAKKYSSHPNNCVETLHAVTQDASYPVDTTLPLLQDEMRVSMLIADSLEPDMSLWSSEAPLSASSIPGAAEVSNNIKD